METMHRTEVIAAEPAQALAAILDLDRSDQSWPGAALPPLWHWIYLLERRAQRDLGADGHPTSGIPAPPGPGRRRMFAGGRVQTLAPLVIGQPATRQTRVIRSVQKQGRTGPLSFVTVRHDLFQDSEPRVREEQDIVYRAPGSTSLPSDEPPASTPQPKPRLSLRVDETLLFRFSALTYNAHRIHYDHAWAAREGYDDLVVHGPLQALMMGELMRRNGVDLTGLEFRYRLVSPMVGPQTFNVSAGPGGLGAGAQTQDGRGRLTATSTLDRLSDRPARPAPARSASGMSKRVGR